MDWPDLPWLALLPWGIAAAAVLLLWWLARQELRVGLQVESGGTDPTFAVRMKWSLGPLHGSLGWPRQGRSRGRPWLARMRRLWPTRGHFRSTSGRTIRRQETIADAATRTLGRHLPRKRRRSLKRGLNMLKLSWSFGSAFLKRGRMEHLRLHLTIGLPDAALVGSVFGAAQALVWPLAGQAARVWHFQGKPDIVIRPDFSARPSTRVSLHCIWTWRLGQIMAALAGTAAHLVWRAIRRRLRRLRIRRRSARGHHDHGGAPT